MAVTASADPGPTPTAAGSYVAMTESLRSAAKWLLAAAAGIAGLLVAGLQLGSLGDLAAGDLRRLCIALAGLFLALIGVGAVVWRAGALLSDEWITLAQLSDQDWGARLRRRSRWAARVRAFIIRRAPGLVRLARGIVRRSRANRRRSAGPGDITTIFDELSKYSDELYGDLAESVGDLYGKLIAANAESRAQSAAATGETEPSTGQDELRAAARNVVEFANYRRTRANFDRLRRALAIGGIAVVIGLVTFAVSTHPPGSGKKDAVAQPWPAPRTNTVKVVVTVTVPPSTSTWIFEPNSGLGKG